jgi:hypothetical protein
MPIVRELLSGSTNGRPIPVVATATAGTLIHTVVAGLLQKDEVFLFANNVTANPVALTVELGGVSAPGDHAPEQYVLPPYSALYPVSPGLTLNNGVVIRAYCGTTSAINISGHVNRIS